MQHKLCFEEYCGLDMFEVDIKEWGMSFLCHLTLSFSLIMFKMTC